MSKDPRFVDLKYKDGSETILDILKDGKLPVVGRVVDVGVTQENYNVFFSKLPENTDIMLHTKLKVNFAVVKVLNYYDNPIKEKEMGPEFVLEHDTYLGEEFLLPAKYWGGIKFVHRPGRRGRYATVDQVIEEMPRYVKVLEKLNVMQDDYTKRTIRKDTVLEIKRVTVDPLTEKRSLQVSDGSELHLLHEDDHVNLTAVDDPKQYHLFELLRSKMLPKVFMFQNDALKDVILFDNQLNSAAMASVDGPLELNGFVDIDVVVGWIRSKAEKSYQTILIPIGLWQTAKIQERCFYSDEEKVQFIDKKYGPCKNVDFVEKSLYLTTNDDTNITWLRSPDFYKRSFNGNQMFDVVKTDFGDSSDDEFDEDSIYTEIPEETPEIPKRVPLMPLVKKKKSMFKKVHEELLALVNKHKPHLSTHKPPPRPPKPASLQRSVSDLTHARGQVYRTPFRLPSCTEENHGTDSRSHHSTPEENPSRLKNMFPLNATTNGLMSLDTTSEEMTSENTTSQGMTSRDEVSKNAMSEQSSVASIYLTTLDHPDSDSIVCISESCLAMAAERPKAKSPITVPRDSRGIYSYAPVAVDNNGLALMEDLDEEGSDYIVPEVTQEPLESANTLDTTDENSRNPKKYLKVTSKDASPIFKEDQTEYDFFRYSVIDVSHCFRHCGLADFADKCFESKLDGSFFKNFDFSVLKEDPFCLTGFQVLKVKKIIYAGWRPNQDKSLINNNS